MFVLQKIMEMLNRKDAKGAKGFIYFLIGTDDQKKNHGLTRKDQGNAEPRLNPPQYDLPDLRGKLRSSLHEINGVKLKIEDQNNWRLTIIAPVKFVPVRFSEPTG